MRRFLMTVILAAVIVIGGWLLMHRQQIHSVSDAWRLLSQNFNSGSRVDLDHGRYFPTGTANDYRRNNFDRTGGAVYETNGSIAGSVNANGRRSPYSLPTYKQAASGPIATPVRLPDMQSQHFLRGEAIRLATFKIENGNRDIDTRLLAEIFQRYDAIAVQNVTSSGLMSRVVSELIGRGQDYVFIDRKDRSQNLAFIFNQRSLMLDDQHWYTVNDPNQLMTNAPLVAWFRTRNADPNLAFTFSFANVQFDSARPDKEIAYLGELFRAIRDDGRGEDDIIIAGDFNSGERGLGVLDDKTGLRCAINGKATNTENTAQLDNVMFNSRATVEFTGNSGVFDFMRQFNMSMDRALGVSQRMPVWAEFSVIEGHSPGRALENPVRW